MTTIVIVALAASGLLWVVAMVEFSRTWAELNTCHDLACRLLESRGQADPAQG